MPSNGDDDEVGAFYCLLTGHADPFSGTLFRHYCIDCVFGHLRIVPANYDFHHRGADTECQSATQVARADDNGRAKLIHSCSKKQRK